MDWDDLRVFVAVARSGRVSAAARQLGVEHTTVLRRIAALERALGVRLFYRTARGYRLTDRGTDALGDADGMERAALALEARARDGAAAMAGRVRVALLDELASHWLSPHLRELRARFPQLEVQMLAGIPPVDITRGDAELAVRTPRPRQPGLAAVRLAKVTTGLYAIRTVRRERVDDRARGLPLLVYLPAHDALQSAAWFRPVLASARVVMTTNSTHALAAAARAGVGIAVLPRFVAAAYPELAAISDDLAAHDLWLVTHPEFRRDPKVRAIATFLREVARDLR